MQTTLLEPQQISPNLAEQVVAMRQRVERKNTKRAYARALKTFAEDFLKLPAGQLARIPIAPQTVAEYLLYLHTVRHYAVRTMKQHKAALRDAHHQANYTDPSKHPVVRETWNSIILAHTQGEPNLSLSVWRRAVEEVIDKLDAELADLGRDQRVVSLVDRLTLARDRALVLVSASYARLTTNELRSLDVNQIVPDDAGYAVNVKRSPDAVAPSRIAFIKYGHAPKYCPVRALDEWLRLAELRAQRDEKLCPVFRKIDQYGHINTGALSGHHLRKIVQRRCALAGVPEERISIRSLRRGSMQQGAYEGESDLQIVESAGLSAESVPSIAPLTAVARDMKRRKAPSPRTTEATIPTY